jgi:Raf kinase inhibitor-like YbhB/YbcL family protein
MTFRIESSAFKNLKNIPRKYTCDGEDISLPLTWKDAPEGTRSFALICDDPDAPLMTWTHWVVYNIPATVDGLQEDLPKTELLESGAKQGMNSGRRLGYAGPCPPGGKAHRYYFMIYALDADLDIRPGESKKHLEQAMIGHVLDQAETMGLYARSR